MFPLTRPLSLAAAAPLVVLTTFSVPAHAGEAAVGSDRATSFDGSANGNCACSSERFPAALAKAVCNASCISTPPRISSSARSSANPAAARDSQFECLGHHPDRAATSCRPMPQIVDKTLTYDDLPGLGAKLKLPDGWRYSTTVPQQDIVAGAKGRRRVQDDLDITFRSWIDPRAGVRLEVPTSDALALMGWIAAPVGVACACVLGAELGLPAASCRAPRRRSNQGSYKLT